MASAVTVGSISTRTQCRISAITVSAGFLTAANALFSASRQVLTKRAGVVGACGQFRVEAAQRGELFGVDTGSDQAHDVGLDNAQGPVEVEHCGAAGLQHDARSLLGGNPGGRGPDGGAAPVAAAQVEQELDLQDAQRLRSVGREMSNSSPSSASSGNRSPSFSRPSAMRARISVATDSAPRAAARHSGVISMGWRLTLRLTSIRLVVYR